jgi:hypothetical protein
MPIAQLALPEQPALAIGVSGERGGADAVAADVALCRISAGEQLDLFGRAVSLAG